MRSVLPSGVILKQVDDYVANEKTNNSNQISKKKYKLFIKKILHKLSISLNFDNNINIKTIKFWTLEIRGHYTKLPISNNYLEFLFNLLCVKNTEPNEWENTLTIHYRLGDLVYLSNKSYVSSESLFMVIKDVYLENNFNRIVLFSDSIEVARKKLSVLGKITTNIEYSNAPTIIALVNCLKSGYFIGTNSKVSFWIEMLRRYSGKKSLVMRDSDPEKYLNSSKDKF